MPQADPRIRTFKWAVMISIAAASMALAGCGEDTSDTDSPTRAGVGGACSTNGGCEVGLVCIAGQCQDPNAPPNNNPNNDPNPDPNPAPNPDPTPDMNPTPDPTPDMNPAPTPDMNPDPEPDAERPDELTGGVSVFEVNITANIIFNIRRGNAGAAFVEPTPDPRPIRSFGDCDLVEVNQGGPEPFGYSAGSISVDIAGSASTMTPMAGGGGSIVYSSAFGEDNENAYGSGDTITISAEGGPHIGAFQGSLRAPSDHTVTSPQADSSVNNNDALAVSWSGGGSGLEVAVAISPLDDFFTFIDGLGLQCSPSSDTGNIVIPAEAMAELDASKLAIVVIKVTNETLDVNGDEIVLNATYAAGNVVNLR